jgi:hypothetical protein
MSYRAPATMLRKAGKAQRENWRCMVFELLPFEMFNNKFTPLLSSSAETPLPYL